MCKVKHLAAFWVLLLMGGMAERLYAQQDVAFTHYWQMMPQFNPAAAGRSEELSFNAAYQSHASGYQDAGGTMYAGADIAFRLGKTRHGAGAIFQNDEIGLFSHKRFSLQYNYRVRLFKGWLGIGAQVDMLAESLKGSKAVLGEGTDPAFPNTDLNGSKFDATVGLFYQRKNIYGGISVLHVTAPEVVMGTNNKFQYKRLYNLTAGGNIKLHHPLLSVSPSVMMRYDGLDFRADFTGRINYENGKRQLYTGANYSPQHAVAFFVGGMFHGVDLTYSYEMNTSGMGLGAGAHEVVLSYRLPLNLEKRKKNIHKSVRWL